MSTRLTIDELIRLHDAEPARVAQALRSVAAGGVPASDLARYAWLVNHVIGEREGDWQGALALLHATAGEGSGLPVLRHVVAAAMLAGQPLQAWALRERLIGGADVSPRRVDAVLRLAVLQFSARSADAADLALALRPLLDDLGAEADPGAQGAMLAGGLNNVVSCLLERAPAPVLEPAVRGALMDGARECRRLWRLAGNWVNHERADYLVAMCANHLGLWAEARDAAAAGLATIDAHGRDDVDRAFLLLELSRAWRGLGDERRRDDARAVAMDLAHAFEPGLRGWFDSRACA